MSYARRFYDFRAVDMSRLTQLQDRKLAWEEMSGCLRRLWLTRAVMCLQASLRVHCLLARDLYGRIMHSISSRQSSVTMDIGQCKLLLVIFTRGVPCVWRCAEQWTYATVLYTYIVRTWQNANIDNLAHHCNWTKTIFSLAGWDNSLTGQNVSVCMCLCVCVLTSVAKVMAAKRRDL